jgi:Peptidase propeptide and YPEB domain
MDNTVKALIIVVIVLVAVLGVAGGFILQGYMSNSNKNITVNQTNTSVNNTTTGQTTKQTSKTSQDKTISASQAISIANKYAARFGEEATGSVDYINGIGDYNMADGDPYYHVELKNIKTTHYGNSDDIPRAWYVEIDANTGAINPRG